MFEIEKFIFDGKSFQGLKSTIPSTAAPLLLVKGDKGFVMCGFLNMAAAEKLDVAAAMVSGVSSFDDVFNAKIKAVTPKAKELGVDVGMVVKDVISKLG
jgi:uncharacterized protein YunC (DUF1805 family)